MYLPYTLSCPFEHILQQNKGVSPHRGGHRNLGEGVTPGELVPGQHPPGDVQKGRGSEAPGSRSPGNMKWGHSGESFHRRRFFKNKDVLEVTAKTKANRDPGNPKNSSLGKEMQLDAP